MAQHHSAVMDLSGGREGQKRFRGRPIFLVESLLLFVPALSLSCLQPQAPPDAQATAPFREVEAAWESFAMAEYQSAVLAKIPAGDRVRFIGVPILVASSNAGDASVIRLRASGEVECLTDAATLVRRHYSIVWQSSDGLWVRQSCIVIDSRLPSADD